MFRCAILHVFSVLFCSVMSRSRANVFVLAFVSILACVRLGLSPFVFTLCFPPPSFPVFLCPLPGRQLPLSSIGSHSDCCQCPFVSLQADRCKCSSVNGPADIQECYSGSGSASRVTAFAFAACFQWVSAYAHATGFQ